MSRIPSEPVVTVVVVAFNEAQRIERRIENLLALDYPREKLEIVTRRLLEVEVMEGDELRQLMGIVKPPAADTTMPLPQVDTPAQ